MLPFGVIEKHLQYLPAEQLEIILEIRNIVARLCPEAQERLDRKGISYYDAERGGPVKAGICQILFKSDQLHLAFIHGAFLTDPQHLLTGDCLAKRYMNLNTYESIPWDAVAALITESSMFDPTSIQL